MKRFLRAQAGMVLTDGQTTAECVFLADGEDAGTWQEISLEEAALLAPAEAADYQNALRGFGVML